MPHQVVLGLGYVGVVRPPQGLVDAQGPRIVPFHILELALVLAEQGQVVELLGHIRVVGTQDLGGTQAICHIGWPMRCHSHTRVAGWQCSNKVEVNVVGGNQQGQRSWGAESNESA